MYYIYILHSDTFDKYYIGYSENPWERVIQHNENKIEKFTGKTKDWKLKVVFECSYNRSQALKIESFIKKQKSRNLIEKLINPEFIPQGYLAHLVRVPHVRD
jgi:putative endonuclease